MILKRLLYALLFPLLISLQVEAQDRVVTGTVIDSKSTTPVADASVIAKGSNKGTQTAADGTFRFSIPAGTKALLISSVGYGRQEVELGTGPVSVQLDATNASLNEVVVVAYGTRKKGDLTGAVTSISAKDFQKGNIASSEQLLQGKVAGLQVTSGGGSAGGGSRIRIRGGASLNASNDPLIVIDGVPVEGNGIAGSANLLNSINPNDIESMSVLKDASATALYGSRASNGVIIITTKKGASGKVKFNFNTQESVSVIGKKVDVLTGDQVRTIVNADAAATGSNIYKKVLGTANTDWQSEIYQKAVSTDNNLSASGSIGKVPFRASVGYLDQKGILRTDKFQRYSSSLNLNPKLFDNHLAINIAMKGVQTKNNFADGGAIGNAVSFDPTQAAYAGNKYGGYYEWLQADGKPIELANRNPLALLNLRNNTSTVNRFIGNVQLDYKLHFFPDLHILANVGIDYAKGKGNDNVDSSSANSYRTGGRRTFYDQKKGNTLADVSLFYAKEISSLNTKIDVLVGHSYQDFYTDVRNYPSFSYRAIVDPANPNKKDTIAGSEPRFLTDKPQYRLEAYFARVNLTIADKYLLTASLRRDASSKFSAENRVGYFPAFAAAWKLKDEFFKGARVVSDLKLRLGYGITGQQDGIGYYSYLTRYSASNAGASYQFGNTFYTFLRPEGYDRAIKWETTTTSNVGLDYGFANNRISGSIDVYFKKTRDLLSEVPIAPGSNFRNTITTNVGNLENKGIEFTVNTVPIRNSEVTWELGFNYTYNKTKITNLLKQSDPNFKGIDVSGIGGGTGNTIGVFAVDYAPYTYKVYKQVYDKATGAPIEGLYEDLNRDGQVNNDDRYYYKKPAPDVLLGLNTQVMYKDFTLGLAGHGSFGNYVYNNFNSGSGVIRGIKNPLNFIGNASTNFLATNFNNNQMLSDYYIENASFFRLDNINFAYNIGKVFNNKANMRVTATAQNVFVITKYTGLDPENSNDTGVDGNIYPRPRIFSAGINLDF